MSYSRWLGSRWYTYWDVCCKNCNSTECNKRDHQTLTIDCLVRFTYRELKDDLDGCIKQLKETNTDNSAFTFTYDDVTEADIMELKSYIMRFMEDVEKDERLND